MKNILGIIISWEFWDKSVDSKQGPNWAPMHYLKSFWSVDIKSVLTFFIWSCKLGVQHGQNDWDSNL